MGIIRHFFIYNVFRYDKEHGADDSPSEGSWHRNSPYHNWIKGWWVSPYDVGMTRKPMAPKLHAANYPSSPARNATGQYNYGYR